MAEEKHDITSTARIIYILYLVGVAFGITGLIGVIMAYVNRSDAPEWLASHYRFQIRTFWLCLLYAILILVIAFVLLSPIVFGTGVVIIMVLPVWWIIRCAKGLQYLAREEAYPDPDGWFF
ncbi:MAG: hypothetical protein J4F29_00225 [Candidatus Latescibacteria bacterium]|nr:hypothetical protein [Candidatus Latescibacterota bacterium]